MPDWRELVSKGLSGLKLGAGEKEEVHAELAAHLEETYKALLSKRAGGSPRILAISSVFPVLPFGVVFLIAIPAGLLMSHTLAHHIVATAFLTMMFGWVLVPGVALFSGGLLVQLLSRRSNSLDVTMN